jgi:uncharacterized HAD superfamily protein
MSPPLRILRAVLCALDLDGVLCDIGPGVAARIAARFGVDSHPSTWTSYDLRHLGLPEARFGAFLDETFADPSLYADAAPCPGALAGVAHLAAAGWRIVAVTARAPHLAPVTRRWLARHGFTIEAVHHTPFGTKASVAARHGVVASVEDNREEAERLAEVCDSWLLDRPYNRGATERCRRAHSWDDLIGRLCQLRLFAS